MTKDDFQNYRVLALKYRPTTFDQLIGQEAMVRTLENSLGTNRFAQAFILTGVRGVGKTTTARIIARALNCTDPKQSQPRRFDPCGECEYCVAIFEDRHVDVLEIDAASHTGVDRMRAIIDSVHYSPVSAKFKVYIIDEIHMLSKNAFNALLKTLEEPPEHVKFIFCTTEPRKIPATIISRCQRFDLKRIPFDILAKYLEEIALKEKSEIDTNAASIIARASDGSVRDALSILDKSLSTGEKKITDQQKKIDVLVCFGTRPEVIKFFPVIEELSSNKLSFSTLLTGQHKSLFEDVASLIPTPDIQLDVMRDSQSPSDVMRRIMGEITKCFDNLKPRMVLVQGDTTTATAVALSAFYHNLPVGHIEAGLRTHDLTCLLYTSPSPRDRG